MEAPTPPFFSLNQLLKFAGGDEVETGPVDSPQAIAEAGIN